MAPRNPFSFTIDGETYTVSDLRWGDGGSPNGITKPNSSRFDDGYYEGTGSNDGGVIPAEEFNSLFAFWMAAIENLDNRALHEYPEMSEGIAATSTPERFVVHAPAGNMKAPGAQDYSQQGPVGAFVVRDIVTDGQYLYIGQDDFSPAADKIYNLDPTNGQPPASGNWSTDLGDTGAMLVQQLAVGGGYLWVACTHIAAPGLYRIDTGDGSYTRITGHGANDTTLVATNGVYVAYTDDTNLNRVHIYLIGTGYQGYYDAGSGDQVYAVCCYGDYTFLLSHDATANEVTWHCVTNSTRVALWSVTDTTSVDITEAFVRCDGKRVYFGHTSTSVNGTTRNVTCMSMSGSEVWAHGLSGGCDGMYVDANILVISDAGSTLFIDKVTGYTCHPSSTYNDVCCGDGASLFLKATNNVQRIWIGGPSAEWQRVEDHDGQRTIMGLLAEPTGRNL